MRSITSGSRGHRRLAKLPDIRAADEGIAGAGDDETRNRRPFGNMVKRRHQAGTDIRGERVDGRVVDGNEENATFKSGGNAFGKSDLGHAAKPQSGTTAVAWISILARSSTSETTCIAAMAGKCRPMMSR